MFCHISSWFRSVNDVLVHHDTFCSFSSLFRSCFPFFLSFVFSILIFFFFCFALVSTCESVFKMVNWPPRRFVSISFRLFLLRSFIFFCHLFFFSFVSLFSLFLSVCVLPCFPPSLFPPVLFYSFFVFHLSFSLVLFFIFFRVFSYKFQKNKEKKTTEMFFYSVHFIFIHLTSWLLHSFQSFFTASKPRDRLDVLVAQFGSV